jgi:hypothetical protein
VFDYTSLFVAFQLRCVKGVLMRIQRRGLLPLVSTRVAARLSVIGLAIVASGCATNQRPSYVNGPSSQISGQKVASVAKEDLEDDGKPAQAPPLRRALPEEDDPSQPWSPNYGGPNSSSGSPSGQPSTNSPRPAPKSRPKSYDALVRPDDGGVQRSAQLTRAQQDDVITRAISAHEMRNQ